MYAYVMASPCTTLIIWKLEVLNDSHLLRVIGVRMQVTIRTALETIQVRYTEIWTSKAGVANSPQCYTL